MGLPAVDAEGRRRLLAWARQGIAAALGLDDPPRILPDELTPGLRAPAAAFVTLTEDGELRGCIGTLDFQRPLWESVLDAAVSAAFSDPRFPPVRAAEMERLRLEISLLEPPRPLADPATFDPSAEGIIVERGLRRGLLLPQVARERGWDARRTLAAACGKAGLEADAWRRPDVRLSTFRAVSFEEPEEPEEPEEADLPKGTDGAPELAAGRAGQVS